MKSFRLKILLIITGVVLAAEIGSISVIGNYFINDKTRTLKEINSISTLNLSSSINEYILNLKIGVSEFLKKPQSRISNEII